MRGKAGICSDWREDKDDFIIFHIYLYFTVGLEKVRE